MSVTRLVAIIGLICGALGASIIPASAADDCAFAVNPDTMTLDLLGDCTTDAPLIVPDGYTLDGNGHTITAIDPPGDHFRGGIVENGGGWAHVRDVVLTASALANVCDGGADRLRGVLFDAAGGSVVGVTVDAVRQDASGCQEGNSIEVRNVDGGPAVSVEIAHITVRGWMKTGIVVNGDVDASIHHNRVEASANQAHLAANGIQVGFGARAVVEHNQVEGSSWCCADAVGTAILLYDSGATIVRHNNIRGNADVGIYVFADAAAIDNNRIFESGPDGAYDIGIGDYGSGNQLTNNKVRGYDVPYDIADPSDLGSNKAIPGGD